MINGNINITRKAFHFPHIEFPSSQAPRQILMFLKEENLCKYEAKGGEEGGCHAFDTIACLKDSKQTEFR